MLADDAFETKAARVLERDDGISFDRLRESDSTVLILQCVFEPMPARSVFDAAQIMPI